MIINESFPALCRSLNSMDNHTVTDIRIVEGEESLSELSRLLGSDTLTEAAFLNAEQRRQQALAYKKSRF